MRFEVPHPSFHDGVHIAVDEVVALAVADGDG
jgi:hypothetical protein